MILSQASSNTEDPLEVFAKSKPAADDLRAKAAAEIGDYRPMLR